MHIQVVRKWFSDVSTIGELKVDDVFHCYTLEDRVRAVGVKIAGRTAIPAGTYSVTVDRSSRFHKYMPHILNVPMFEGIRIHAGNTEADTEGCILLGKERGIDSVLISRIAFTEFFGKLASSTGMDDDNVPIFRTREETDITIVNASEVDNRSAQGTNPALA